ncbi:MAG TPA: hypothetical protein VEJ63_15615 [Planctomycetota bacterium]|nr:hypothetical protein [Planctomycetota bacterium]
MFRAAIFTLLLCVALPGAEGEHAAVAKGHEKAIERCWRAAKIAVDRQASLLDRVSAYEELAVAAVVLNNDDLRGIDWRKLDNLPGEAFLVQCADFAASTANSKRDRLRVLRWLKQVDPHVRPETRKKLIERLLLIVLDAPRQ